MKSLFLSVIMITYGHEKYIQQAIEGFFMQKTNFPLELIIANDASPDNTDTVIKNILKNLPSHILIHYTKHETNIGMIKNHHFALQQAQGKYMAICDGDDYWTDENKLQKQVDFLEKNLDYSIICHNFKTQNGDVVSDASHFDILKPKENLSIIDLSKNNVIPTLTAVFRNQNITFSEWSSYAPLGDLILFMQLARQGKIKYLNEKMAVYRENVGVWSGKKVNYEKMVFMFDNLAIDYKDLPAVRKNLIENRNKYIKAFLKEKSLSEMNFDQNFSKLSQIERLKLIVQKII
jgi:glycosyltransferase involved in cell wall biosynthesis